MRLFLASLAALCIVAGLSLVTYLVVWDGKSWPDVWPVFTLFFASSILLFLVSSFLTRKDLIALREAGILQAGGIGRVSSRVSGRGNAHPGGNSLSQRVYCGTITKSSCAIGPGGGEAPSAASAVSSSST